MEVDVKSDTDRLTDEKKAEQPERATGGGMDDWTGQKAYI